MTKETFVERILALQSTLYYVSCGLLNNREDRDDAVQESIRKALDKRESLRDEKYFQTWVIRILINECHNVLRRKKREVPTDDVRIGLPPEVDYGLFETVSQLEEKIRLPVILHYMEGYTTREVAQTLRVPESTIKSRLSRARKLLGQMIDIEEVFA